MEPTYYCVKNPGPCDGSCSICPISEPEQLSFPFMDDKPQTKADDKVRQPSHYAKWPIEPITFVMRNKMEFWRGNLIKYAARAGHKKYDNMSETESEIVDLEKVRRYAEIRIRQLKGEVDLTA